MHFSLGYISEPLSVLTNTYHVTNESREIWCHLAHFGSQVLLQFLSVVCERDHTIGEALNVDQVNRRDIHSFRKTS